MGGCFWLSLCSSSLMALMREAEDWDGGSGGGPSGGADRAQKHGMDEFISANPCSFDHAALFEMVQHLTLEHRINDSFASLVRILFTGSTCHGG